MNAGVFLYSGRPDPRWTVSERAEAALAAALRRLPELAAGPEPPSGLGYRGAWVVTADGRRVVAFNGVVTSGPGRFLADAGRAFERSILDTAPHGVLPMGADALFAM